MSSLPGMRRVLNGAFVSLDPRTFAVLRIIPFQYDPETLCRKLESEAVAPRAISPNPATPATDLRQTITFTLALDATD
jgi:hypothetical protein